LTQCAQETNTVSPVPTNTLCYYGRKVNVISETGAIQFQPFPEIPAGYCTTDNPAPEDARSGGCRSAPRTSGRRLASVMTSARRWW
jgi:hypothetical protein